MRFRGGATNESIHYWMTTSGDLMVSVENTKTLMSFKTVDDAINWLYLNGFKGSAREMNQGS